MKTMCVEDLYRAKENRRKRLAALPIEEKVRIMEQLQDMGRTMRAARTSYRDSRRVNGSDHEPATAT